MRKIKTDGTNYQMGIAPPTFPPNIALGVPDLKVLEAFLAAGTWTNGGTAGAITQANRFSTTIAVIKFDSGTTGWASVQPTAMSVDIQPGAIVKVNAGGGTEETTRIQAIFRGITVTTIGSIVYDSGTTGLCTIQPAKLAAGESKMINTFGRTVTDPASARATERQVVADTEAPVSVRDSKYVGLQPGVLIRLNSGGGTDEYVTILSQAWNKDGTASIRVSTVNNHAAGETLGTVATFRAYFANTHVATEALVAGRFSSTVTVGTGYFNNVAAYDLSVINIRPTQDLDEIHLSVRVSDLTKLVEGRVMFDVDSSTNDFTRNFFYYPFRASDLVPIASGVLTTLTGTQTAIQNDQISTYSTTAPVYSGTYTGYPEGTYPYVPHSGQTETYLIGSSGASVPAGTTPQSSTTSITPAAESTSGDEQWTELFFKVRDLVRVGSDFSRNLSNVAAIRIQFNVTASVTVRVASLTVQGSYGPDVGATGADYFYRYRGRSSLTGAASNPSPPVRAGIRPHRQRVKISCLALGDPQVDKLDVYRFGGALTSWKYVGTADSSGALGNSSAHPATAANDALSGTTPWNNTGNATACDGVYATAVATSLLDAPSQWLKLTNLGFAVPAGSVVTGIKATVTGHRILSFRANLSINASLVKAGTIQTASNKSQFVSAFPPGLTDTTLSYGSSTDTWTLALSDTDVNNAGFGVAFQITPNSYPVAGVSTTFIDCAEITVYYSSLVNFNDDYSDDAIANSPTLELDNFQPFPTIDIPKSGTCNVIGNRIVRTAGATFNQNWAPGSVVEVNGIPQVLYAQPYSTSVLETHEGTGTLTGVPFLIRGATLLGQPLPSIWGPMDGMVFGCGDTYQAGTLFVCKPYNPDSSPDRYQIDVTPPSEPLINGCMYGTRSFVWSSERMFEIITSFGDTNIVRVQEVYDGGGMFTRWGIAVGVAMYTVQKDGIFASIGGSRQSITSSQLYLLFPHDGQPGQDLSVGGATFKAPDFTSAPESSIRLRCYDHHLYFEYLDTGSVNRTLVFNETLGVWGLDNYVNEIGTHYGEEGKGVHSMLMGGTNGILYQMTGTQDDGVDFDSKYYMPFIGDLAGQFIHAANAEVALISNDNVSLITNIDNVDYTVTVPSTGGAYKKQYTNLNPVKGKAWAFAVTSTKPFKCFGRDFTVGLKEWGSEGEFRDFKPFADLERQVVGYARPIPFSTGGT
jgi:hypothetical protein